MLIDRVHLMVQAGSGGNGCDSYYRRTDRKMIPDGGDGGKGGGVIFRADTNAPSIGNFRFKQHLIAESGTHGGSSKKRGRNGKDLTVLVPSGTRLYDREKRLTIRDLNHAGDEVVVLEGGRGGVGNLGGKQATLGEKGAALDLELTFRIMADAFLVGLPNSGKSRLMNALTRAHVKEETYPFATRSPQIGVYQISDFESVTLCELPSIYEASHEGRGMGADFLRHLENARLIVYVLDPLSKFSGSLAEGLAILRKQLETFDRSLVQAPSVVTINKMDLPEAREKVEKESFDPGIPVFRISALTGEGLAALTDFFKQKLNPISHA